MKTNEHNSRKGAISPHTIYGLCWNGIITGNELLVMNVLLELENLNQGRRINPTDSIDQGQAIIAKYTGHSRKLINGVLKSLEEKGLVTIEKKGNKTDSITINWDKLDALEPKYGQRGTKKNEKEAKEEKLELNETPVQNNPDEAYLNARETLYDMVMKRMPKEIYNAYFSDGDKEEVKDAAVEMFQSNRVDVNSFVEDLGGRDRFWYSTLWKYVKCLQVGQTA